MPTFRQMRDEEEILQNQTSTITINYEEYQYIGDTDKAGNACGWGSTVEKQGMRFSGTFFNNQPEGLLVTEVTSGTKYIEEYHKGKRNGWSTVYTHVDAICNTIYDKGRVDKSKFVTNHPEEAFYSRDAKPIIDKYFTNSRFFYVKRNDKNP